MWQIAKIFRLWHRRHHSHLIMKVIFAKILQFFKHKTRHFSRMRHEIFVTIIFYLRFPLELIFWAVSATSVDNGHLKLFIHLTGSYACNFSHAGRQNNIFAEKLWTHRKNSCFDFCVESNAYRKEIFSPFLMYVPGLFQKGWPRPLLMATFNSL